MDAYCGDIVHFPEIQIPRPDVSITFDQDAHLAAETRTSLLDLADSEHLLIAGMHLGEFGFARIERTGKNYCVAYEQFAQELFEIRQGMAPTDHLQASLAEELTLTLVKDCRLKRNAIYYGQKMCEWIWHGADNG